MCDLLKNGSGLTAVRHRTTHLLNIKAKQCSLGIPGNSATWYVLISKLYTKYNPISQKKILKMIQLYILNTFIPYATFTEERSNSFSNTLAL